MMTPIICKNEPLNINEGISDAILEFRNVFNLTTLSFSINLKAVG